MSLNYTITNRRPTASVVPDVNNWRGKNSWIKQVEDEYGNDPDKIMANLSGVERYAYIHDVAYYGWVTKPDGTRSYEPDANVGKKGGDYANPRLDPETQRMYQQALASQASTATQGRTGTQQASQGVFDTSTSRYSPAHQNIVNF